MGDKRCFVQFLHPGGEHAPNAPSLKVWNTGNHRRKFLKSQGRFLDPHGSQEDSVVFWGEREPESRVIESIADPLPDGPRCFYKPYYVSPISYRGLQSTESRCR